MLEKWTRYMDAFINFFLQTHNKAEKETKVCYFKTMG